MTRDVLPVVGDNRQGFVVGVIVGANTTVVGPDASGPICEVAVAVMSAELSMFSCEGGGPPCDHSADQELPTVTKSRDILMQMMRKASETNTPLPPYPRFQIAIKVSIIFYPLPPDCL